MKTSDNFKRGVPELVILCLLLERDMYGYELFQEIKTRSDQKFTLIETSLYPVLYRLQSSGYISSYETVVGVRRKRAYYHLETSGKVYFSKCLKEYQETQQGIRSILKSCGIPGE